MKIDRRKHKQLNKKTASSQQGTVFERYFFPSKISFHVNFFRHIHDQPIQVKDPFLWKQKKKQMSCILCI